MRSLAKTKCSDLFSNSNELIHHLVVSGGSRLHANIYLFKNTNSNIKSDQLDYDIRIMSVLALRFFIKNEQQIILVFGTSNGQILYY